jgi:hypothetical protein
MSPEIFKEIEKLNIQEKIKPTNNDNNTPINIENNNINNEISSNNSNKDNHNLKN